MRSAIQSMKKVEGTSFVVPRHNWTSGRVYSAYDDDLTTIPSNTYYVLTEENQVYICLQQGRDNNGTALASTVKPAITDTVKPFKTSDGYKWKFMYTISPQEVLKFTTSEYIPVKKVGSLNDGSAQYTVEQTSVDGSIDVINRTCLLYTSPSPRDTA